jgi:hypothetical protein
MVTREKVADGPAGGTKQDMPGMLPNACDTYRMHEAVV